jgi:exonuclease SbcD
MPKIIHFADAHIDMANYGRHDPETGLPIRIMDFLTSLDEIVDAAIAEDVDLVIFAGDAYKDRNPAPTFQREWGQRVMRLSQAGIPTLLLVGNHDISPAVGRAHAMAEFSTLHVPHVRTLAKPIFLSPEDLRRLTPEGEQINLQVIAIPWISRSGMMAYLDITSSDSKQIYEELEKRLANIIDKWLEKADPEVPTVLTAHASVQGATYGGERSVMLGKDLILPGSLLRDPRLDYVALGHIHKPQNLNEGEHPPIIYPGSIERLDFGEAGDQKYYVLADVNRGKTQVEWRALEHIRPFIDRHLSAEDKEDITEQAIQALSPREKLSGSIVRLVLEYPRAWEPLIDENAIQTFAEDAFEFHLVKQPLSEARIRLPQDQTVGSLSPLELLKKYWQASHTPPDEIEELNKLAEEIIHPEEE